MKKILFISIFIQLILLESSYSIESVYKTDFYQVDINEGFIQDAKEKEINRIKIQSFDTIITKILTKDEILKLSKFSKVENNIDLIIQSILIENEFISQKKYKANIKINFNYIELINLLRKYKINYTDYQSPDYLLLVAEKKLFSKEGLSKVNSFYKKKQINKYGLINFIYPYLSTNDRFLIPYDKIIHKNKSSLKNIANKYKTNFILLVLIEHKNNIINFDISVFTSHNDQITSVNNFFIENKLNYEIYLYNFLNNWWKKNNLINNSIINNVKCFIKNSNIHELNFINSKINSISQVKSNKLNQINLGLNINEIIFYGNIKNLISKLSYERIALQINSDMDCLIQVSN